MVYICAFIITCTLFSLEDRNRRHSHKLFFFFLASAPLVLIAVLRHETVGIDILVYVKRYFLLAYHSNSLRRYSEIIDTEKGYLLINFLVSRFTDKLMWIHFFNILLSLMPVVVTLNLLRKKLSITYGIFCYCAFFYNWSLSAVRQSIACSFVLLAVALWDKKKYGYAAFMFAIAISFHITALFAVSIFCIYLLYHKKRINVFWTLIILIIGIMAVSQVENLFRLIQAYIPAFNNAKYNSYFNAKEIANGIGNSYIGIKLICICSVLLLLSQKKNVSLNHFMLMIQICSIVLIPVASKINFSYRILRYFDYFNIILLPQCINIFPRKTKKSLIINTITFGAICLYWIMTYVIQNNGGTIPYKLK